MNRIVSVALVALVACGGGKGGASSPQDVYDSAKSAAASKNWKALFQTIDPEKSDLMLFAVVMGASFSTMGNAEAQKELEPMLAKHGLDPKAKPNMSGKEGPESAAKEAFKNVKDKPALFAEVMAFTEKNSKGKDSMKMPFDNATLKDVKIDGEKATGTSTQADGKTTPMHFVKRAGSWYISMQME